MKTQELKTILIVEDDQDILFSMEMLLECENYQVQTAKNGKVALDLIKTHGLPHLILLDMMMPVMDGWEFSHQLAAQYKKRCPIIVMTGAADAQQRARDINANDWIEKPFELNKLLVKIRKNLDEENKCNKPLMENGL